MLKASLAVSVCFAFGLGACVGGVDGAGVEGQNSNGGSGGNGGSTAGGSGATGAGGQIGTGGATGSGGANGGGGASGGGGKAGTGGATGSGGANGGGAGGRIGTGGTGGTIGAGGAIGSGGRTGSGGATGAGGRVGGGGTTGATGSGGATGAGGSVTAGLGPWITGYAATMYGNDQSGDCAGYPNFSDATPIKTATCSRVVTVANFSAGTANNASFYGATGDVSSLWVGAECNCNGSDTCASNQAPSCPAEQQAGGNCGICVAVKCDPAGTFSLGGTTHDQDCNKTQYAVVQIIDACPHNHPTNVASSEGWCTSRQANHVDLSCSALGGISTKGMNIGQDGWLNVDVQKVDCSIGLGLHPL